MADSNIRITLELSDNSIDKLAGKQKDLIEFEMEKMKELMKDWTKEMFSTMKEMSGE